MITRLIGCACLLCWPVTVSGQEAPFNPWAMKLAANSVPAVTEWRGEDTEGKVMERTNAALLTGPAALEELAGKLLGDERRDGDGRYTSPYFYRMIGRAGPRIKGEDRFSYHKAVVEEWRKKHPESLVAMVAEARLCNEEAYRMIGDTGPSPSLEENRQRLAGLWEKSRELLEKSRELRTKDAGWHVTRLVMAGSLGDGGKSLESAMDDLLECFPECGYAISRGVTKIHMEWEGDQRRWERWLRGKLSKLPLDVQAKAYTLTLMELGESMGVSTALFGVTIDRELVHRGMDVLAAEYPHSIGVASQEAVFAAFGLYEPKRIQAALKRAGGRLDGMALPKDNYEFVIGNMTRVPWEPKRVGLPDITSFTMQDTAFKKRMDDTAAEGARAMELLFQRFRSEEIRDKDGGYNSCSFCQWFDLDVRSLEDIESMMFREKLLAEWEAEFPASPFMKLAAAHYWASRAWLARGSSFAGGVSESRWKGFSYGLKRASSYVQAASELRETEPAWLRVVVKIMMGSGGIEMDGKEFAELTEPLFENYPDSQECMGAIIYASAPKWGGEAGGWEKFIRKSIEDRPADDGAVAYATAVIAAEGYAFQYPSQRQERYGNIKPDKALVKKGLDLLKSKFPESMYHVNAEALIYSDLSEEPEKAYAAMKRMNGRLDMRVWWGYNNYDRCVRWVTWKKSGK